MIRTETEAQGVDGRAAEAARIADWRLEQLVRAGFEEPAALLLAAGRHVDLHVASDLLRRGCPVATALRILL